MSSKASKSIVNLFAGRIAMIGSFAVVVLLSFPPGSSGSSSDQRKQRQVVELLKNKIEEAPDDIEPRVQLSAIYIDQKSFHLAIELLEKKESQLEGKGLSRLAEAYHGSQRFQDEIRVLRGLQSKAGKSSKTKKRIKLAQERQDKVESGRQEQVRYRGQTKQVVEILRAKIRKKPQAIEPRIQLARIFLKLEKHKLAARYLKEVEKSLTSDGLFLLTKAYHGQRLYQNEIELLRKMELKDPKNPKIKKRLAKVYGIQEKKTSRALREEEQAREAIENLKRQIKKHPKKTKYRVKLAAIFFEDQKYQRVIDLLKEVTGKLRRRGLSYLAQAYHEEKKYIREIKILLLMETNDEKSLSIKVRLARAYLAKEATADKAVKQYRDIISKDDKYLPAYDGLLGIFERDKNLYERKVLLEVMLTKFGEKPAYLTSLCKLYAEDNYSESAISTCRKALTATKKTASNHVYLGLTYQKLRNQKQAKKILVQAAKLYTHSEFAQWAAGQILLETNNFAAAFDYFQRGVKLKSVATRSLIGLARCAVEMGKYELALKSYKKACKLDPGTTPEFRKSVAELHKRQEFDWYHKFSSESYRCQNQ